MADIKLVIKLPEESYKATCIGSMLPLDVENVVNAIKNGTPLEHESILDKIRAEIEAIIGERNLDDYDFCSGLICARKIIDKYKAESGKE